MTTEGDWPATDENWVKELRETLLWYVGKNWSGGDAEDVVQDTFVRVQGRVPHCSFPSLAAFRRYCLKTAGRIIIDRIRKSRLRTVPFSENDSPDQPLNPAWEAKFRDVVDGLSPEDRRLLEVYAEYDRWEARAAALGLHPSKAWRDIRDARARVRGMLFRSGMDPATLDFCLQGGLRIKLRHDASSRHGKKPGTDTEHSS